MLAKDKRLTALAWAAAQADMSYGRFTMNLTQKDKLKIYRQYQSMLEKRKAEETLRPEEPKRKKASGGRKTMKKVASLQA